MRSAGNVRVVIDTNVLLSGLLWRGTPYRLIEQVRAGTLTLVMSPALIAEFTEAVQRRKFRSALARMDVSPEQSVTALRRLAEIVDPLPLPKTVSRDPDDDAVLALAVAARSNLIISGDADLLSLSSYAGIPIVNPATALVMIGT